VQTENYSYLRDIPSASITPSRTAATKERHKAPEIVSVLSDIPAGNIPKRPEGVQDLTQVWVRVFRVKAIPPWIATSFSRKSRVRGFIHIYPVPHLLGVGKISVFLEGDVLNIFRCYFFATLSYSSDFKFYCDHTPGYIYSQVNTPWVYTIYLPKAYDKSFRLPLPYETLALQGHSGSSIR
jgi:hypothetical protein